MTKEYYTERINELSEQFKAFRKLLCWRSASYRIRQMAKLYAQYHGKTYDEGIEYITGVFEFRELTR